MNQVDFKGQLQGIYVRRVGHRGGLKSCTVSLETTIVDPNGNFKYLHWSSQALQWVVEEMSLLLCKVFRVQPTAPPTIITQQCQKNA